MEQEILVLEQAPDDTEPSNGAHACNLCSVFIKLMNSMLIAVAMVGLCGQLSSERPFDIQNPLEFLDTFLWPTLVAAVVVILHVVRSPQDRADLASWGIAAGLVFCMAFFLDIANSNIHRSMSVSVAAHALHFKSEQDVVSFRNHLVFPIVSRLYFIFQYILMMLSTACLPHTQVQVTCVCSVLLAVVHQRSWLLNSLAEMRHTSIFSEADSCYLFGGSVIATAAVYVWLTIVCHKPHQHPSDEGCTAPKQMTITANALLPIPLLLTSGERSRPSILKLLSRLSFHDLTDHLAGSSSYRAIRSILDHLADLGGPYSLVIWTMALTMPLWAPMISLLCSGDKYHDPLIFIYNYFPERDELEVAAFFGIPFAMVMMCISTWRLSRRGWQSQKPSWIWVWMYLGCRLLQVLFGCIHDSIRFQIVVDKHGIGFNNVEHRANFESSLAYCRFKNTYVLILFQVWMKLLMCFFDRRQRWVVGLFCIISAGVELWIEQWWLAYVPSHNFQMFGTEFVSRVLMSTAVFLIPLPTLEGYCSGLSMPELPEEAHAYASTATRNCGNASMSECLVGKGTGNGSFPADATEEAWGEIADSILHDWDTLSDLISGLDSSMEVVDWSEECVEKAEGISVEEDSSVVDSSEDCVEEAEGIKVQESRTAVALDPPKDLGLDRPMKIARTHDQLAWAACRDQAYVNAALAFNAARCNKVYVRDLDLQLDPKAMLAALEAHTKRALEASTLAHVQLTPNTCTEEVYTKRPLEASEYRRLMQNQAIEALNDDGMACSPQAGMMHGDILEGAPRKRPLGPDGGHTQPPHSDPSPQSRAAHNLHLYFGAADRSPQSDDIFSAPEPPSSAPWPSPWVKQGDQTTKGNPPRTKAKRSRFVRSIPNVHTQTVADSATLKDAWRSGSRPV